MSSDRGSKMNPTILKSKLYLSWICIIFDIVLSADFIQKTYQFAIEIQSVNINIAIRCFKCFMIYFIGQPPLVFDRTTPPNRGEIPSLTGEGARRASEVV